MSNRSRIDLTDLEHKVDRVLRTADFEGLLRRGAPEDEYESEAQMITERLTSCHNPDDVRAVIVSVFKAQFDQTPNYDAVALSQAAIDIWIAYRPQ